MKNCFDTLLQNHFKDKNDYNKILSDYKKVDNFKIEDNSVSAIVNDKNNKKNYIKIIFNQYDGSEKKAIETAINSNPIILHKLINNVLPVELFDLNIFTSSIDDITVECSCSNSNTLCNESIILLNILNDEIIKNPYIIFSLRGLDFAYDVKYPIKSINEIFQNDFKYGNCKCSLKNLYEINSNILKSNNPVCPSFDFLYTDLFKSLIDEIKTFKTIPTSYIEYYRIPQFINPVFVNNKKELNHLFNQKWKIPDNFTVNLNQYYQMDKLGYIRNERALFAFLNEFRQLDTSEYGKNIQFWHELLELTFELVENNAIIPQLFKLSDNNVNIRWIPEFYNQPVLNLCKAYFDRCPDNLITFDGEKLSKENQVIIAISLITKGFIQYYIKEYKVNKFNKILPKHLYDLFFTKAIELKDDYITKQVNELSKLLSIFSVKDLNYNAVLFVEDRDGEFNFKIKVKDGDDYKSVDELNFNELGFIKFIYDLFLKFDINLDLFSDFTLNKQDFLLFYFEIKEILEEFNIESKIPFKVNEGKLKLKLAFNFDDDYNLRNLNFYEWRVMVDQLTMSIGDFLKISKENLFLMKIHGDYFHFNEKDIELFNSELGNIPALFDNYQLLKLSILKQYNDIPFEVDDDVTNLINVNKNFEIPESLNAELRPYQKRGFSWLLHNIHVGFGSILADDMGLGKTIQVLATILYLKEHSYLNNSKILIIVPSTLLSNWANEIKKFTPSLSFNIFHGNNRKLRYGEVDIILTSYNIVRHDFELLNKRSWFLCVIDEAQVIKNPSIKLTQVIKSIHASNKIALTGTPIENRLIDFWSIFDFANKGYLHSLNEFKKRYQVKIERNKDEITLNNFKKLTSPFVLRRLKTDENIISDLPDKLVNDVYCSLSRPQKTLYNKVLNDIFCDVEDSDGIMRKNLVLKLILSLKQICNHPAQYLKSPRLNYNVSGKINTLMEILGNILDVGEKVVIFTQYAEMGKIMEKLIFKRFKCNVLFIHGDLSFKKRDEIIDLFQNDSNYQILISTLKTGGVGLNLTSANNVIHYDLWWNPAVENQATDRVYRIGQKENVMVYRLITEGTLEEQIDLMIRDKLELAGKSIDSEETLITEMDDDELLELFSLRSR